MNNRIDAIYARQSVDKKDSISIESQIEFCKYELKGGNCKEYTDKGYSGKNTDRPKFQELVRDIKRGLIAKVVVYKLDRISRSILDFANMMELFQQYNVEFVSSTEKFDTSTPMGRAMLNIVMTFAQLERETTAERVRDNYHHRVSLGAWPGGPAPYGYALSKAELDGRKVSSLIADENAKTVLHIFEEYVRSETSLRALAKALTEQGIHGPKREAWDNVTLSRILRNPVYAQADEAVYCYYLAQGIQIRQMPEVFDGVHGCLLIGKRNRSRGKYTKKDEQMLSLSTHEGIIPSSLWLRAQDKLSGQMQLPRANAGKYSWLTGLLKCGKCGYAVKVNYIKSEQRCKLVCSGRSNFGNCDESIDVDLRELETHIANELQHILDACPAELPTVGEERAQAEAVLEIEQKIDRLVNALAESSDVAVVYISKTIEKLHAEREQLLHTAPHSASQIRRLDFSRSAFDEEKLIAAEFIERIELDGNHVNIIWKV